MEKLVLKFIGEDFWSRPVFEDQNGQLFKDTNCGEGEMALCTAYGGFEGEPDTPIEKIDKFQGVKIEIIGMENEPTPAEKFNYAMLGRLQADCEYYLGFGNRNPKQLWAGSEFEQIVEMKRLYSTFDIDKKPEWLTWEAILTYEKQMVTSKQS